MKEQNWLNFLGKSIILGVLVSIIILFLVPDLRSGHSLSAKLFGEHTAVQDKLTFNQTVNKSAPAVVNIYSYSIDNRNSYFMRRPVERTSLGSGVIMTEDGYILTCLHVIKNAESILVGLQDSRLLEAQIVGYDALTDLAVLKVSAENLHVIPQVEDPNTMVGDVVLAIGNPYNLGQTITQGIVSRTGRNGLSSYFDFIQMDAVLNEGNSGGALVDSNGYLVGINNATFKTRDSMNRVKEVDGVSFALPYMLAKRVMDEIIANGKVTRGQLGFVGKEDPDRQGIVVESVSMNGPAQQAGLQPGDLLLSINGVNLESAKQTQDIIAESRPGSILNIKYMREKDVQTVDATVAELGF